jgi:putative membrane protein
MLDALLSLWRSVRMAREIAVLYEGRPGPLGTLSLMRDIAGTLAAAGASELIADAGAEAFGSTFAATLSAKVGQGMAMGILTIRVGLAAMRLCRPIPFQEEERPRIAHIRDQVFKAIFRAVNTGKQKS